MTQPSSPREGRESRDEIVARVEAEQQGLHPNPEYSHTARKRLWVIGLTMVPISLVIGWLIGLALGWPVLLWVWVGLGISLGVFYIAYVIFAERDDGVIQRELDAARREREAAP